MDILLLSRGFFPFYRAVVQELCDRGISMRMHCALTDAREKEQIADTPYILLPHAGGFRSEENIRLLIDYLRREQIGLVLNPNIQIFDLEKLKFLNRTHNFEIVYNGVNNVKKVGIHNINMDFIYGCENDSIELLRKDNL